MSLETNQLDHIIIDKMDLSNKIFSAEIDIIIKDLKTKIDKSTNRFKIETEIDGEIENDFQKTPKYRGLDSIYRQTFYRKTQHWTGIVESIGKDYFSAKLVDKNDHGTYEIGEFDKAEVSPSDYELLSLGAVFYWSVGYASENGQIEKRSLLRFKRSIGFTCDDIDKISDEADLLNKSINWD